VSKVREWERGFHEFVSAQFPQVGDGIRSKREITKDLEPELRRAIDSFKKSL